MLILQPNEKQRIPRPQISIKATFVQFYAANLPPPLVLSELCWYCAHSLVHVHSPVVRVRLQFFFVFHHQNLISSC